MSKVLSAKTRAEMYRGAATNGLSKQEVDSKIALAEMWSKVEAWEEAMARRFPDSSQRARAMVWQRDGKLVVEPYVDTPGVDKSSMSFGVEPADTFPSEVLMAKLMLVLG